MFEPVERRVLRFLGQVVAVLAALVGLACLAVVVRGPNLIICRLDPGESSAIATLKNLHQAQQQFAACAAIDLDGDGRGEFGTFGELTGSVDLRTAPGTTGAPHRLDPPQLGRVFLGAQAGRVRHANYLFQVWLPTGDGRWIGDGSAGTAPTRSWCAYAWPADAAHGKRAFFVDEQGDVYATTGGEHRYLGTEKPVPVDAALPSHDAHAATAAGERTGRDGQSWVVVN